MASLDLGGGDFADPSLVPISRFSVSFLSKCPLAAPISFQDKEQVEFTVKPEEDLILEGSERTITRRYFLSIASISSQSAGPIAHTSCRS